MATEVVMPQMGESIAEGTITKWLVQVGDRVERDQPLFEISTDKVDAEIPSPAAGVVLEIRYQAGETVAVQKVVAILGEAFIVAAQTYDPRREFLLIYRRRGNWPLQLYRFARVLPRPRTTARRRI